MSEAHEIVQCVNGGLREQIKEYEKVMRGLPYQDVDPAYEPVRMVLAKDSGERGEGG